MGHRLFCPQPIKQFSFQWAVSVRRINWRSIISACMCMLLLPLWAQAADPTQPNRPKDPKINQLLDAMPAAGTPPAANKPHPLAQSVYQAGATTCAATVHQLASILSNGKEVNVLQMPQTNPDRNMMTASMVQQWAQGRTLITMAFAPGQANGCGASFQKISYVQTSCVKAASKFYPGMKVMVLGDTSTKLVTIDQKTQVMLMPAGGGCVVVEQELVK